MRTNEEYGREKVRLIDFILDNLGSIDKQKLKNILESEIPLSTLTPIYALALEGQVLSPEDTLQNVVTQNTIIELREQIRQVQADLIESIEQLEKKINELKKKEG